MRSAFCVSVSHICVSVHQSLSVSVSLSLMKASPKIALFAMLAFTNVLMDRGDKDNKGEDTGRSGGEKDSMIPSNTHKHIHTHTHTHKHMDGPGNARGREADLRACSPPRLGVGS